ncbi:unnamed protein product [Amoebophrya sp. A120]|nr:unnamed protein product [Amoebophrya sp. A120]|eukprot:GSA120T00022974001.1
MEAAEEGIKDLLVIVDVKQRSMRCLKYSDGALNFLTTPTADESPYGKTNQWATCIYVKKFPSGKSPSGAQAQSYEAVPSWLLFRVPLSDDSEGEHVESPSPTIQKFRDRATAEDPPTVQLPSYSDLRKYGIDEKPVTEVGQASTEVNRGEQGAMVALEVDELPTPNAKKDDGDLPSAISSIEIATTASLSQEEEGPTQKQITGTISQKQAPSFDNRRLSSDGATSTWSQSAMLSSSSATYGEDGSLKMRTPMQSSTAETVDAHPHSKNPAHSNLQYFFAYGIHAAQDVIHDHAEVVFVSLIFVVIAVVVFLLLYAVRHPSLRAKRVGWFSTRFCGTRSSPDDGDISENETASPRNFVDVERGERGASMTESPGKDRDQQEQLSAQTQPAERQILSPAGATVGYGTLDQKSAEQAQRDKSNKPAQKVALDDEDVASSPPRSSQNV